MGAFQPLQLTLARERRGYTKSHLAALCGVDRKTVTEWEGGRVVEPPVDVLAEHLSFEESFFFDEPTAPLTEESANFRALTSMSARQTRQTLATASLISRVSGWLDERFMTPEVDLPTEGESQHAMHGSMDEPTAVALVRSAWQLGDQIIPDMLALMESRGVRVFALPPEIREVDAFAIWLQGRPTVFLNTDRSAERLRFDLAHELGHLVMHRGVATVKNKKFELEANAFAGHLLVPSTALYAKVGLHLTLDEVFVLKRQFRVSATSMVFRVHECGLINDWQYRTWMVELSRRGYRVSEPGGVEHERSQFLAAVLRLAREDGYTLKRMAAELRIPVEDLSGAFAGLAPMPVG